MPLDEQARERELLGLAPVDAALLERGAPALELLGELRVDREAVGHREQLVVQRTQSLLADRRHDVGLARRGDAALVGHRRDALAEGRLQALVRLLEPRARR